MSIVQKITASASSTEYRVRGRDARDQQDLGEHIRQDPVLFILLIPSKFPNGRGHVQAAAPPPRAQMRVNSGGLTGVTESRLPRRRIAMPASAGS